MDRTGTDQTGADDRVSEAQHSALADVSPSDADSVRERRKLARPNGPYDETKRRVPETRSKLEM